VERRSLTGEILIPLSRGRWLLTLAVTAIFVFGVGGMFTLSYTNRVKVSGEIIPSDGLTPIRAPAMATISKVLVSEGQSVNAGDVLLEYSSSQDTLAKGRVSTVTQLEYERQEAALAAVQKDRVNIAEARLQDAKRRHAQLQSQLSELQGQAKLRQSQVDDQQAQMVRLEALSQQGYVSRLDMDRQRSQLLEQRSQLLNLQRQITEAQAAVDASSHDATEIPLLASSEINELASRSAQLRVAAAQNDSVNAGAIRAPRAGIISMMSVHSGQPVMIGDQLLTIWPSNTPLQAQMIVGSESIGLIDVGQEIFLRHRSYPYQKYGMQRAVITQVSKSPMLVAGTTGQSGYVVYAKLGNVEGAEFHSVIRLVPGMEFDADVLLERRRLLDWVLRPFRGFQARQSIATTASR